MANDSVTCETCNGVGKVMASGIRYSDGASGPYCAYSDCPNCGGGGTIPRYRLEWIKRGEAIRQARRDRGWTLHRAALALQISVVQLCQIEAGQVDNSAWQSVVDSAKLLRGN